MLRAQQLRSEMLHHVVLVLWTCFGVVFFFIKRFQCHFFHVDVKAYGALMFMVDMLLVEHECI